MLLFLLSFFAAPTSHAFTHHFEASGGYQLGSTTADSGTANGLGFNVRGGFRIAKVLMIGADVHYAMVSYDNDSTPTAIDNTIIAFGPVVGFHIPGGFRFWFAYALFDRFASETSAYSGKALKPGVGWAFLPFLSANFEYILHSYDSVSVSGTEIALSPSFEDKALYFSLSFLL